MIERLIGTAALRTLAWLGRKARRRGDVHEAAHCEAAVLVGHSTHADHWPCTVSDVYHVLADAKERAA